MRTHEGRNPQWILFDGDVTRDSVTSFLDVLASLDDNVDTMNLALNSRGGSYRAASALAQLLCGQRFFLRTINLSRVDSAAVQIFAAGNERIALRGTGFYFHSIGSRLDGVYTEKMLGAEICRVKNETEQMVRFLMRRTGTKMDDWRKLLTDDGFEMSDAVSVEMKLATRILDRIDIPPIKSMIRVRG